MHSSCLSALGKALDAVEKADRGTSETMKCRRLLIEIFSLQALVAQKEYAEATKKALVALKVSEEIKPYRCKQMRAELYKKLAATSYGGLPAI